MVDRGGWLPGKPSPASELDELKEYEYGNSEIL